MASSPLYGEPPGSIRELLSSTSTVKKYVSVITKTYEASLESPLDGSIHPSFRVENISRDCTTLSPARPIFEESTDKPALLLKTHEDVMDEEDAFKKAMKEYESTAKYKTGINPDSEHTMKELESVVAEAIEKHCAKDKRGFWGKIGHACKILGESKDDIEGWLGLLPSESQYFSVVCGGLKLILKAAARMKHVHDKVLEALAQIPTILNSAQRVLKIYKGFEKLSSLSRTFYSSILTVLGHILKFLRQKSRKNFVVVFQPANFQEKLLEKVENMTRNRNAFNSEADICQKEMISRLAIAEKQGSEATAEEIRNINHIIKISVCEQNRALRVIVEMQQMLDTMKRRQSEMGNDIGIIKEAVTKPSLTIELLSEVLRGGNNVRAAALSLYKQLETPEGVKGRPLLPEALKRETTSVAKSSGYRQQLLSQLDYDQNAAGADMMSNYGLGSRFSREDQDRSIHIIKSAELATWVTTEISAVLIINGNIRSVQRQSALSFMCARLAFALEQIRSPEDASPYDGCLDIVPLYFFCGQHATGDYTWESPAGIVNSLLAQIITLHKGLNLKKAVKMGSFDGADVRAVLKRFACVLAQISAGTTVLCIIDGLSFYLDKRETAADAELLIHQLLKLARPKTRKLACVFKVLLTAPNRLHTSEVDNISQENILNIPAKPARTEGFTAMRWHLSIGQQLQELAEAGN
ncbi:hypothetical protein TGAM01_v201790 [Trichoderma gamsii]|uniref:DUF7708 domain-containing protein n=1 Tax=Trichoderma gamsii TaxID=398673 RepID=A0A2P4ZZ63_9HYPO|nr:hypothetical protein TGAM01_v201790 [Trichoderma gamsii]PON29541.1 hypothetical protein TGAM01_v201790 [Trichoderma gamsii]